MNNKVLIVEDQYVEAHDLQLILQRAGYEVCGIARSVPVAKDMIAKENPGLVLLDIFLKGEETGIDLARELRKTNVAFIYLSANSNEKELNAAKTTQPYGFLVKPYREKDLLIMLEIARYRHEHTIDNKQESQDILNDKLTAVLSGNDSRDKKLAAFCRILQTVIPFDYLTAGFNTLSQPSSPALSFLRIGFDEYQEIDIPGLINISRVPLKELIALMNDGSLYQMLSDTFHMRSCTSLPVRLLDGNIFTFSFYSSNIGTYDNVRPERLAQFQKQLGDIIQILFAGHEPGPRITTNKQSTLQNKKPPHQFEGIVGKSHLLLSVLDLLTKVAPSQTSVLILGESGTGKERVADCIHNLSSRKGKPFVKVNCAALPWTLIESELFGHEKGAFTGAHDKRIGKFEKADTGTIFLDEIGEMPTDLQVKLLRVLQEKYIERIGARDTTPVDVRIIAATNRNLEKEVAEGRFRLDLYYRLNVFPIELPPLRERTDDIPLLTEHFINHYNRKTGKNITGIKEQALKNMMDYHWPGNIRELENMVERSMLLAGGTMIEEVLLPASSKKQSGNTDGHVKTIHENERDYISSVLKKCNGRVWGAGGAAEVLNIPPSTLKSKMIKLGIRKENME